MAKGLERGGCEKPLGSPSSAVKPVDCLACRPGEGPKYSVVVPAFNESQTIGKCLESLLDQTVPRETYEILVVDDGSTDDTAQIVSGYPVKYFFQSNQGPASARNLGVKNARGEIVLFTDADCEVTANWIEEMTVPFADKEIAGVKGFYRTRQREFVARFVQQEYEAKSRYMLKSKYIDFLDTYAAAYRKSVFLTAGGFDTQFRTASAEDCDLSYVLSEQGYKMVANPKAIVYHFHPDSLRSYWNTRFRNAFWRVRTYRKNRRKLFKDSHTPPILKIQILLLAGIIVSSALHFLTLVHLPFTLLAAVLFLLSEVPFAVRSFSSDRRAAVVSPLFALFRAAAYLSGVTARVLQGLLPGNRLIEKILPWNGASPEKRREKRHESRASLKWPFRFETGTASYRGITENISLGGACLRSHQSFPTQPILHITFEAPGNRRYTAINPKVAWVGGNRSNGKAASAEIAVSFRELPDGFRQVVYEGVHKRYLRVKRFMDVTLALLMVMICFPLFLIVALLIELNSPGPILFRQRRLGKNQRDFSLFKFRTMVKDAEACLRRNPGLMAHYEKNFKIKNDPRITGIGRLLRELSIDELPQLFNILKGEMSFVGPRPVVERELAKYGEHGSDLLLVKPGLTGLWQVEGRLHRTTYKDRIRLDMEYIDTMCFTKDVKILLKTIPAVMLGHGTWVET